MFVERVTAIRRGAEAVEVKAKILNALIKYFLLVALIDTKNIFTRGF